MKYSRPKIIGLMCLVTGVILFSPPASFARRIKDVEKITPSLSQMLTGIGYGKEVEEISALIAEVFPNFEELRNLSIEDKIFALARMIIKQVGYDDYICELPDILKNKDKKANCVGYSQLFYVLGRSLGLDVEVIAVYPEHAANLIKLDNRYVILDLSVEGGYIKSKVFNWEENYIQEASVWRLKEESVLPRVYQTIQRLDENGIIAVICNSRGTSKTVLGLHQEAISDFNKAIELNPNFAEAYNNRGVTKTRLGLHQEAISDFNKAIELNPAFATAYNSRGVTKARLGLYQEAISDFNKAIELNPAFATAYNNRGNSKADLGLHQEAISDFNKAIEFNPTYAKAYNNRGDSKTKLGLYQEAISDYDRAIELNPAFAEAYDSRGVNKARLGLHQEAISDFNKAIELNPAFALAYSNRGLTKYYGLNQEAEALVDFREAIRIMPGLRFPLPAEIQKLLDLVH